MFLISNEPSANLPPFSFLDFIFYAVSVVAWGSKMRKKWTRKYTKERLVEFVHACLFLHCIICESIHLFAICRQKTTHLFFIQFTIKMLRNGWSNVHSPFESVYKIFTYILYTVCIVDNFHKNQYRNRGHSLFRIWYKKF